MVQYFFIFKFTVNQKGYQTSLYTGHITTGHQMGTLVLKGLNVVQIYLVSKPHVCVVDFLAPNKSIQFFR